MGIRMEYSEEQERLLRITEIEAILENNLYEDEKQEKELMKELVELEKYEKYYDEFVEETCDKDGEVDNNYFEMWLKETGRLKG